MADGTSRGAAIADWCLKDSVARRIFARFGVPDIDLMASQSSRKVLRFISWSKADSEAVALDSLSPAVRWDIWDLPYLFPPFSLIGMCLQKIRDQKVKWIIVVLPWSQDLVHFGTAMMMLLRPPVRLSHTRTLVVDLVSGQPPLGWKRRPMIACLLTWQQAASKPLSHMMPNSSSRDHGGQGRNQHMDPAGEDGSNMPGNVDLRKLHQV